MALSFHQLHIFYTVAEKGSFSMAAQALHMTQPAVTMQIQALEEYFGVKLLIRTTKKITLSEAGQALLPYARQSVELMKKTENSMSKYAQFVKDRLQLGASLTVGEYIMPRLLGMFGKEYPHFSISMKVMNSQHLVEEIVQHQINFALVEAPVHHPDIFSEPILNDELKLVLPTGHPLNELSEIRVSDMLRYPFVLREQGSGTRQVMENVLREVGYDNEEMKIVMELGSTGAVKAAVESGLGISILSSSTLKHELALGLLTARDVKDLKLERHFYAIYLNTTILPISAFSLLNYLREYGERQKIIKS